MTLNILEKIKKSLGYLPEKKTCDKIWVNLIFKNKNMADFIEWIKLSDWINKKEEKRLKDHLSSLTEEELNSFKRSKSVESLWDEVKIQLEILISEVKSNRLKNTKEYIDISDESMAILKNNPELAKEIKNWKIRFEWNRVVLPDGYENLPKLKQLKRIMHYLNFLEKNSGKDITKENKEEKIQILKELSESSTDFILDKRFLQYKYMISIYDDILREGYIIEKKTITETNENWDITTSWFEYNIINPENGKKAEWPYAKELLNPRFINPKLLDMTIISSIASRYNLIDQNGTLGQKWIIKFLLNKHGIEWQFWEEIQEESLLLLDWERVDKQLELKMNLYKKKGLSILSRNTFSKKLHMIKRI